jgi:thymidine phosphorylase
LPMSPIRNESRGRSEDAIPLTPALSLRERENVPQSANMAKAVSRSNTAEDPAQDLSELVVACAALLLVQSGKAKDLARAREEAEACLASGAPRKKWDEMLAAQGADLDAFNRMLERDCNAPAVTELRAARAGSSLGATQTGSEKSFGTWALGGLQRNL